MSAKGNIIPAELQPNWSLKTGHLDPTPKKAYRYYYYD